MDVLADLLPAAHLVKSETTARDRKQKNKQYRKFEKMYDDEVSTKADKKTVVDSSSWDHVERRSGEDRRSQGNNRGRWLDSRIKKDRRQQYQGIFVKI